MSELDVVSDAGHPAFMQRWVYPVWTFPWPAVQISSMKTFSLFQSFELVYGFLTRKQLYLSFLISVRRDGLMKISCGTGL